MRIRIDKWLSFVSSVSLQLLCWQETVEYAEPHGATDEELFSTVYHKLVHSPALETMLQVEHSYALAVRELMAQKDEQVGALTQKWVNDIAFSITVNIATMKTHFWDSSEFTESNSLPCLSMRRILVLPLSLWMFSLTNGICISVCFCHKSYFPSHSNNFNNSISQSCSCVHLKACGGLGV